MSSLCYSSHTTQETPFSSDRDHLIDMLAFSGHELNNTLTRILLSVDSLLSEGDEQLTNRQKRAVQSLNLNARLLRGIAHTYLMLAQLEDATFEPSQAPIDPITEIIEPLMKGYAEVLLDKQQTCDLRAYCSGIHVLANPALLTSALDNLLNNAIKYGRIGSTIQISVSCRASSLEISIKNSVSSLNSGALDHIFDRFARGSNVTTQSGTGIGLYLVKQVADMFAGTVCVETCDLRNQVTFILSLPIYCD